MPGGVGFAEGRILRLTKLSSLQVYMCPKFSIIIPVYNVAPYLRECLDSVFKQTFEDWEAVCVDDGSTDGSGAILDEYASKDVRFNVIHKSNGGVVSARKTGYDASKGDWIWFVDGDDLIKLTALETLDRAVKLYSFDMLRFHFSLLLDSSFLFSKVICLFRMEASHFQRLDQAAAFFHMHRISIVQIAPGKGSVL